MDHLVVLPIWLAYELYMLGKKLYRKYKANQKWKAFQEIPIIPSGIATREEAVKKSMVALELLQYSERINTTSNEEEDHLF